MNNVTATATGAHNYGVYNVVSSPSMNNVTATATGGTNSYGVYNSSSSPSMNNVTATATGGSAGNDGVYNVVVVAVDSELVDQRHHQQHLQRSSSGAKVADTALGGAVGRCRFTCVGVYTTAFVALGASCGYPP